ncbi:MAG: formate dehydrogenase accessory sulfurtransferase FdhD [Alphaproteobacteria bacterium]|nr:formate dehydrogenase accessory sulfurtransferase FdhD [Alphaproteobacteria bacterium]
MSPLAPTAVASVERVGADGGSIATTALVAEEAPVALVYNGISHAVMMATPADLADFSLGFSLSEGIIERTDELFDIAVEQVEEGIEVRMAIALDRFAALKDRRRNLTGRTGCGLCGVDSLKQAVRHPAPIAADTQFTIEAINRALAELPKHQVVNRATGAVHAAAWVEPSGAIALVREDVGRHNALDKLIGALARRGTDRAQGFAIITSRCSVEMVQKAAVFGVPLLVAISAPTALAKRLAEECRLTLVALARTDSLLVISHPWRLDRNTKRLAS